MIGRRPRAAHRPIAFAEASGWRDVVERASVLRRRRRHRALLAVALTVVGSLVTSFAASGGFGRLVGHTNESPLTILAGDLRTSDGGSSGSIEIELPGTASLIPFRPRSAAARLRPLRLRPVRVLRTAAGPTWTTRSFYARWFLNFPDQRTIASAALAPREAGARKPSVRLCGPCLAHDSGRVVLTLAQVTALVNERLRLDVRDESGAPMAGGDIDRQETPIFWHGRRGLTGGHLEVRRPDRSD